MSGIPSPWRRRLLWIPLILAAAAAPADPQTAVYSIRGSGAALVWRSPDAATDVFVFTFSELAVQQGETPRPGPRVVFSVARTTRLNGVSARRQWVGDAEIQAKDLTVAGNLEDARLDVTIKGDLLEQSGSGAVMRREVEGRLQVRWTATAPTASTTTSFVQQTPAASVTLQAAGPGRMAEATATLTIAALGPPLNLTGPGSILSPASGLLTVARQ